MNCNRPNEDNVMSRNSIFYVNSRYAKCFRRATNMKTIRRNCKGSSRRSACRPRPIKGPLACKSIRLFRNRRLHGTSISAVVPTLELLVSSKIVSFESVLAKVHYYALAGFPTRLSMKADRCLRPITSRVTIAIP